jgi:fructokinase
VKDVDRFLGKVGGAPANVCAAYTVLGGESALISQFGQDPFGDKIIDVLTRFGIDTHYVKRTDKANTSLAFVSLKADGNRDFSFYRNPGADMLLKPDVIASDWFSDAFALHFCSVSLGNYPMKAAHDQAIDYATDAGTIVSFDPNIRLPLWPDESALRQTILEYMPRADLLKISDEELEFITGLTDIEEALDRLFVGRVKLILYTEGAGGARAFTQSSCAADRGIRVAATDTTGAGDGFIGSFLYQLSRDGVRREDLGQLQGSVLKRYLMFSNQFCAYSVQRSGAMDSYGTEEAVKAAVGRG